MDNNLIFTGLVKENYALLEATSKAGNHYWQKKVLLKADDGSGQTLMLTLMGDLAIQFNTCKLTPNTLVRAHLHVFNYSEALADTGEVVYHNSIRCWRLEVLDADGHVSFICRQ